MIAVKHQESIEVNATVDGQIIITQESFECGKDVSIYLLPENIEIFYQAIKEVVENM
jgi:hypothetical protein